MIARHDLPALISETSGQDVTHLNAQLNPAQSNATTAMVHPYYSGLDSPTELPAPGGDTPYTDGCATWAAQAKAKYDADEDRQGQLNRLYPIQQQTDNAKDEVD